MKTTTTQSAHTPGPWSVSEIDATGEPSEYYIFIEPSVAVVERKTGAALHDMPDARLIAAAPDLYSLGLRLEPWLSFLEYQEKARGERQHDSEFLVDLRAALAKVSAS